MNQLAASYETDSTMRGMLSPSARHAYMFAGKATITLQSARTGSRFTYTLTRSKPTPLYPKPVYFVAVLNGPDNVSSYRYLGTIFDTGFRQTAKSTIAPSAPSCVAFVWFLRNLESEDITVWHEGACGRCGRKLTVPESIASGIGPTCAEKGF